LFKGYPIIIKFFQGFAHVHPDLQGCIYGIIMAGTCVSVPGDMLDFTEGVIETFA